MSMTRAALTRTKAVSPALIISPLPHETAKRSLGTLRALERTVPMTAAVAHGQRSRLPKQILYLRDQ
ncbi:MAG: hypothetical protein WCF24_11590 [Acidimicrobiales bacterium]